MCWDLQSVRNCKPQATRMLMSRAITSILSRLLGLLLRLLRRLAGLYKTELLSKHVRSPVESSSRYLRTFAGLAEVTGMFLSLSTLCGLRALGFGSRLKRTAVVSRAHRSQGKTYRCSLFS